MKVTAFVCFLLVTFVGAKYEWSGTDWKWVPDDPKQVDQSDLKESRFPTVEGSGDNYDDEEDYGDDDYDEEDYDSRDYDNSYNFNSNNANKNNYGFENPVLGSSDDEDFVEGSGGSDFKTDVSDRYPQHKVDVNEPTDSFHYEDKYEPEKEDNLYVDGPSNNFDFQEPHHSDSDISFGENSETDQRVPFVEVTSHPKVPEPTTAPTTTTTEKYFIGHEDSPEVHRKGPTSHRPASFFAQPGILAAVIGGAVVGLLCAILLVMFIVYRMRKKDEGSYALDEPKRAHNANSYTKPPSREFYA